LALYVLAAIQFFGFVPPTASVAGIGLDVAFAVVVVSWTLVMVRLILRGLPRTQFTPLLIVALLLGLYGTVGPALRDGSSLSATVRDGRGFLGYVVLAYAVAYGSRIRRSVVVAGVRTAATLLVCIVLLWEVTGVHPPGYWLRLDESLALRLSGPFSPLLLLCFTVDVAAWIDARLSALGKLRCLLLLGGLGLQGHRSVFLAALVAVGALVLLRLRKRRGVAAAALLATGVALVAVSQRQLLEAVVAAPIREIVLQEGAIASRLRADANRWAAFAERPLFGYGFVDESSPLGARFMLGSLSRFEQTLGTVDGGYLDLLVRFGAVGSIAFVCAFAAVPLGTLRRTREDWLSRGAAVFLLSYLGIALTWSVFSYPHGIGAGILGFLLLRAPDSPQVPPHRTQEEATVLPAPAA
jgi:O-antigen ligase